jgi:hypothetical protein
MGAFTDYSNDFYLDWLVGKTTPAAAASRYITATNTAGGAEQMNNMNGSANRILIDAATYWTSAAASSSIASHADITFTAACAAAGATVGAVSIWTAITGGTKMSEAAVTSKTLTEHDSLKILSGNLTLSVT